MPFLDPQAIAPYMQQQNEQFQANQQVQSQAFQAGATSGLPTTAPLSNCRCATSSR